MSKREPGGRARYEEIAYDLAKRIACGELPAGSRILGRSSLAGTYQVSPETIRRAVAILHDRGVLQSIAGSGIRVVSKGMALEYLESLRARASLEDTGQELHDLLARRRELDDLVETTLEKLIHHVGTVAMGSRRVEEVTVKAASWAAGRTLGEIRLRSRTGATAIAVVHREQEYFSPGSDITLNAGDVVTFIGSESARERARGLLEATEPAVDEG